VVDPESIDDPACRSVLGKLEAAELQVRIWDTTTDVGIASFVCLAMGCNGDDADPEFGSGCHPARHIALLRSLTAVSCLIRRPRNARSRLCQASSHPRSRVISAGCSRGFALRVSTRSLPWTLPGTQLACRSRA
jgi:ribosomal protein S12 methylthiotransferase accessory factor